MVEGNLSISELQSQALRLMQSLVGVITPNYRMVTLSIEEDYVNIVIVLNNVSESDSEEIEDLKSEFDALQTREIEFSIEIVISQDKLSVPDENAIVVYMRRET